MDERSYWKIKILIDKNAELTAEIERYKMAMEQDLEDHKKIIVDFRRKITQLECVIKELESEAQS